MLRFCGEMLDRTGCFLLLCVAKLRLKGDGYMKLLRVGLILMGVTALLSALAVGPSEVDAQPYSLFHSDKYGFSMKYPANWVVLDDMEGGNYYKVFQAADPVGKVRPRINVAVHKPVKASIEVFLNEFRTAVKDLESKSGNSSGPKKVRLLDEGKFDCDVPGAYYFFIEALEEKVKQMMNVIIVFYKNEDVLLRVSCIAQNDKVEQFHNTFNDVLLSINFKPVQAQTTPASPAPITQPTERPTAPVPGPQTVAPTGQPAAPPTPTTAAPPIRTPTSPTMTAPAGPTSVPRGPTSNPAGPSRAPSSPGGIVR
jgi:hypothetical protein